MALTDRPFICKNEQEVLCLHEVETLLRFFSDEDFAKVTFLGFGMHIYMCRSPRPTGHGRTTPSPHPHHQHKPNPNKKMLPALLPRLELCLLTDHSRCLEKALTLWKDPTMLALTRRFSKCVDDGWCTHTYIYA